MFSARLKNLRIDNGYTQKEIAEKLGTSQPSYQNWEKGSANLNMKWLKN